ncbi:MAG: SusC/RagA family TonB-linked outer membrane protein [Chitinophagaceae bacterium]
MKKLSKYVVFVLFLSALPGLLSAQNSVSGKITDAKGVPVAGATVSVRGGQSVQTDADGVFTIKHSGKEKITISHIGYTTQVVNAANLLNVVLQDEAAGLSEVIVTGLSSSIKRGNAANAVTRLNASQLTGSTRPPTLDGAMSGKVPGAQITANTGAPGGGMSIRLRGVSTVLGSSEPLFVIDGVIVNNSQLPTGAGTRSFNGATGLNAGTQDQAPNRISDINPADIESIDILKGPSAAAVYGTRANGGVVIITTKRGKSGKTKLSINQDLGFTKASKLLGSSGWDAEKIAAYGGAYNLSENDALNLLQAANGKTWDYEKIVWGNTGFISNTNATVSGGNEKTRFYVSGSLQKETGIQKKTGYDRKSLRVNLDHKLNDFIDFKISTSYLNTYSSRSFTGNDNNGISLSYSMAYIPNFVNLTRNADGSYPVSPTTGQNLLETVDRAENKERTNRFLNSGELNFNLLKNDRSSLKLSFRGGMDYLMSEPRVYMPEDMQYQSRRATPGASRFAYNKAFYTYLQSSLTFNTNIGNNIDLTTQAIVLRDDQKREMSWIQGDGLLPGQRNPSTAQVRLTESLVEKETVVAFDLGQEVNWDDKVVGRIGVRADKSTLAGTNYNKLYYFPRGSVAINLTNFDFWKSSVISQLKPRVAYGQTSGFPIFNGAYSPLSGINYGGLLGSIAPVVLGLSKLDPERASELEFGLDLSLFNNKVTLEATYYNKKVKNFLFAYALAPTSGVTSFQVYPVGDLDNKGIELGLNATVLQRKDFEWTTSVQFWKNKSKITRLTVPPAYVANSGFGAYGRKRLQQGYSPTAWWGPDSSGALIAYHDAQPKFQLSWNNTLRFAKGFEFSMFWHTSQGGYNASLTRQVKDEGGTTKDWSNPSKTGNTVGFDRARETAISNFVMDASYIRLREASLYYTLPANITHGIFKKGVEKLRLGISGQNLLTLTDYFGYDPEVSNFNSANAGGSLTTGVDLAPFPAVRRVFFHLNVEF